MGEVRESRKEKRFKKLRDAPKSPIPSSQPKIQKVPFMLRDHKNFDKYYVPRAVAIGPFHHGNPRCKLAQKYKLMLTLKFADFVGQKDEDLYKKIEEKIKELRECYVKEATEHIDDGTLAWMLFLDGCSTLQFIYSLMNEHEEFEIKRDQVAFAQQDLFLLENQIPYQVLELLMSSSDKREVLKHAIESFVQMHIIVPVEKQSKGQEQKHQPGITENREQKQEPDTTSSTEHKVDITENTETKQQDGLTTDTDQKQQPGVTTDANHKQQPGVTTDANQKQQPEEPTHLLDLLRKRILGPPKKDVSKKKVGESPKQTFRNVQELSAAGIHFQPSKTNFLGDISFKSHCFAGFLSLPPISVDDSTGPKFMNLIAYEMCPDFQNDYGVASYIGFLDALIDHADDVKKLRSASVLFNFLGSDKEVAQLFNEIGTDLVPNTAIYLRVKAELEKHYKTKWKTWMSQFCHDHFSSPWTILAFLGVLSALGLSGIQTWYTVPSQPSPCEAVCQYLKTWLHIT
ncbi:hypothetical protein PRUPE_7G046000 [Prunus persica]|uniref:Uncharacterized protein n=1 Tax=Prunus persica TaxID=3760 RepID=A0A251N6Q2_PRUPE|nr:putative UPF0481 protein At3g02645 [Prunus persica]ONH95006.1 hypothetical protein PRUPE_7G046000 [Prunus persica]